MEKDLETVDGIKKGSAVDLQTLIRHMAIMSDKTLADLSREMGKSSSYLSVALFDKRTPRTDLFVKIATTCGYRVEVSGGDPDMKRFFEDMVLQFDDNGELVARYLGNHVFDNSEGLFVGPADGETATD